MQAKESYQVNMQEHDLKKRCGQSRQHSGRIVEQGQIFTKTDWTNCVFKPVYPKLCMTLISYIDYVMVRLDSGIGVEVLNIIAELMHHDATLNNSASMQGTAALRLHELHNSGKPFLSTARFHSTAPLYIPQSLYIPQPPFTLHRTFTLHSPLYIKQLPALPGDPQSSVRALPVYSKV